MASIGFANSDHPIVPSATEIRETDSFQVQWSAVNASDVDVEAFTDRLVVTSIPEGCPGTDGTEHPVVFDSTFDEPALGPGQTGPPQSPTIGPFAAGAYRLTVTLADDSGTGFSTFNCINIDPAV